MATESCYDLKRNQNDKAKERQGEANEKAAVLNHVFFILHLAWFAVSIPCQYFRISFFTPKYYSEFS